MPVIPFNSEQPVIGQDCFIAPDAWLTGKVTLGERVSIFFGAVLRGDIQAISVGAGSNIQEHAVLHSSHGLTPCLVGCGVTVGHRAIVHGASVGNNCIIGMGATILDGAEIAENCIIGANSLVTMNTKIPRGVLAVGSPAKVVRPLTAEEIESIKQSAQGYIKTGASYANYFSNQA